MKIAAAIVRPPQPEPRVHVTLDLSTQEAADLAAQVHNNPNPALQSLHTAVVCAGVDVTQGRVPPAAPSPVVENPKFAPGTSVRVVFPTLHYPDPIGLRDRFGKVVTTIRSRLPGLNQRVLVEFPLPVMGARIHVLGERFLLQVFP